MERTIKISGLIRKATACAGVTALLLFATACDDTAKPQPATDASTKKSAAAKPASTAKASAAASGKASAAPAASGAATGAAAGGAKYREVPHAEWVGVVGPKLPAGATVAHKVFEGWPTEKALFVLTKENNQFFARVFADGKVYKQGPLANPALEATRVNAVSFFDADGDGKTDAAVIARYKENDADKPYNALLAWTTTSIERMTALEPKILNLDSIDKIREELKKP